MKYWGGNWVWLLMINVEDFHCTKYYGDKLVLLLLINVEDGIFTIRNFGKINWIKIYEFKSREWQLNKKTKIPVCLQMSVSSGNNHLHFPDRRATLTLILNQHIIMQMVYYSQSCSNLIYFAIIAMIIFR